MGVATALRGKLGYIHLLCLFDPVLAVHRLQVSRRVPVVVIESNDTRQRVKKMAYYT
jgi:PII-like signaling protein